MSCSPAPCVLPATQASEGGFEVADAPITFDPLNANNVLVGTSDFNCPSPSTSGFHFSSDGGLTWTLSCMPSISTRKRVYWPDAGAPMVGYDRSGNAFIADGYGDSDGLGYGLIAFQTSDDGINWSGPAVALGGSNVAPIEPWMVVDTNAASPHVNTIYLSAVMLNEPGQNKNQLVVAHSDNGGAHWTQANVVPVQNYPAADRYTNMTVGKDGTVYLSWMYCSGGPHLCNNGKGHMLFSKSSDGGNTWSFPTLVTTVVLGPGLPNSHVGVTDYPAIGVDTSDGVYAGSLYVVVYTWTGTYMRIGVVRSTDGGNTWSKPVPVAPPSADHDQFFPWLSVSQTGLVGVSWLDRRNDPANINYQPFAAISTDGGKSFKPNVLLSSAFSNPNNNGYPDGLWMGTYTGNTWAGSDLIAAWMDSSNGVDMQVMVGGIRVH